MDLAYARRDDAPIDSDQDEWKGKLVRRVLRYVASADVDEEARRKSDRIGASLYYSRHWNVKMPDQRAALTVNFAKALILHKIAIMTKQDPQPVVEANDFGSTYSAELQKKVLQKWWQNDSMPIKLRKSLLLANTTRTSAIKFSWDTSLHGGAGDVTGDVVPGWQLIMDKRADSRDRMQYIGNRATMRREEAALAYPDSAELIFAASTLQRRTSMPVGTKQHPASSIGDPWKKTATANASFGQIVNGSPVVAAFTTQPARENPNESDVQIVELLHRDRTLIRKTQEALDASGMPRMEYERDDDNIPIFEEYGKEYVTGPSGEMIDLPKFRIKKKKIMEEVVKPKYPFWRRTTVMFPDMLLLDDRAWDGPANYMLVSDGESLEGPWVKGSILDLEDSQVTLNVSLSLMMDNLRYSSFRPILADQNSNIEGNTLLVKPGQIIRVSDTAKIKPFEFPQLDQNWFAWCNFIISNMERLSGAQGVMQGESAGRTDSAAGYDLLAEIGGSRIVAASKQMERAIAEGMEIVTWFQQRYYDERHAMAMEDEEGNITSERLASPMLFGSFSFRIVTGSTMAWSESSVRARLIQELQLGLLDKIAYWQRTNTPDWKTIADRMVAQNPVLTSPPPQKKPTSSKRTPTQPGARP